MSILYLFFLLAILAALCFSFFRLYQLKSVAGLAVAAVQLAAFAFLLFTFDGTQYRQEAFDANVFAALLAFTLGFAIPAVFFAYDFFRLRRKIKERFGLSVSLFLYQNDRNEYLKVADKEKYVDQIIKPRADMFSVAEILAEIRVERADISKNVQRQLELSDRKCVEGDYDGAYAVCQTLEKIFNRSPSLYFNMGNIDYARSDFEAAARCYRRAADCAGSREYGPGVMAEKLGLIYYNLGNANFLSGKYARAIEAYKSSVEIWPDNGDALFNMAFCHARDFEETGDTERAVEAFKLIVEDMPENLHAWFHFGKCLQKMGSHDQAAECFSRVVAEDVMFYEAWFRLANTYDERGIVEEAARAYHTAIQIKPDFIDAYNNLGILLSTAGRHGEALKVLKNALRLKPGDAELVYNIGMTQYESGKYDEALGEFLTCEKLRPDDGAVLYMIAVNMLNTGRQQDAFAYLKRAVNKDPDIKERAAKERVFQKYLHRQEYESLFVIE